jgi:hypothetical protein
MSLRKSGPARRVGITHFPLEDERDSQEKVPSADSMEEKAEKRQGHRLSRRTSPQAQKTESEGSFEGKGGKGGKTRGSRAGLLSTSRKTKQDRK